MSTLHATCGLAGNLTSWLQSHHTPLWRNWQTRMVQVHVHASGWGFNSLQRHFQLSESIEDAEKNCRLQNENCKLKLHCRQFAICILHFAICNCSFFSAASLFCFVSANRGRRPSGPIFCSS